MGKIKKPNIKELEKKKDINGLIKAIAYSTGDQKQAHQIIDKAFKALFRLNAPLKELLQKAKDDENLPLKSRIMYMMYYSALTEPPASNNSEEKIIISSDEDAIKWGKYFAKEHWKLREKEK